MTGNEPRLSSNKRVYLLKLNMPLIRNVVEIVVFMMYSVSMRVGVEFDSAFYNTCILKTNITVM